MRRRYTTNVCTALDIYFGRDKDKKPLALAPAPAPPVTHSPGGVIASPGGSDGGVGVGSPAAAAGGDIWGLHHYHPQPPAPAPRAVTAHPSALTALSMVGAHCDPKWGGR